MFHRFFMAEHSEPDLFRLLPSVDELLRIGGVQSLTRRFGHAATVEASRAFLEELRGEIAAGSLDGAQLKAAIDSARQGLERRLQQSLANSLRPVINATGVILHTNLGRAPLSREALGTSGKFRRAIPISSSIFLPASAASATFTSVACSRNY